MMGATLGGGIGRLHGIHCLIIDALKSVRLVTADGSVLEVSEHSHPDLFWGIRGAGQNFGIVTSATYELHPLSNGGGVWTSADILLTPDKNVSYFDALAGMHPLPPQLTVETIMNYNGTLDEVSLDRSPPLPITRGWSRVDGSESCADHVTYLPAATDVERGVLRAPTRRRESHGAHP